MKETRQKIGMQVRTERKKQQASQSDLASEIGISTKTVTSIENGSSNYNVDKLIKICDKLGIEKIEL